MFKFKLNNLKRLILIICLLNNKNNKNELENIIRTIR